MKNILILILTIFMALPGCRSPTLFSEAERDLPTIVAELSKDNQSNVSDDFAGLNDEGIYTEEYGGVIMLDGRYKNVTNPNKILSFFENQIEMYIGNAIIVGTYELKENSIIVKWVMLPEEEYDFAFTEDGFLFDGEKYKPVR